MKMRHLLHAMGARIGNRAETFIHTRRTNGCNSGKEPCLFRGRGIRRKVINADIGTFGDHKDMHRRLRIDVTKRKRVITSGTKRRLPWK